ncbi:SDR family NAD(P)-dependent oxidoreductase [Aquisediminimonas profunda]|uniref:SDR family NAD(P)-dependent oxidoreductase n=1 Tax=Aquisediminimonas profunda TaxID=1550733 RepID=UPI001C633498|nr:SDR family NAD(P)-dependent oxidoreductase [Aquisediminimonas profunda]
MPNLLIFGLGYTALRIAASANALGWEVHATGSAGDLSFDDVGNVKLAIAQASHILSSVPPVVDGDPVLQSYGEAIRASSAQWIGYLSSTGVYGDARGAWVDESAPIRGRRESRNQADRDWQQLSPLTRVFRLPGIYGPGRSALDRVKQGNAHRIDLPHQVFSRIHVDDIVSGVLASFAGPPGSYNLADDAPCSQNRVIEAACDLLDLPHPPLLSLEAAELSREARAFYSENRRVSNAKAKHLLGWMPAYADFAMGLRALSAITSPAIANAPPPAAIAVQL